MPMNKEDNEYIASPMELINTPFVTAWSVTQCEDPDCPAVHVFFFNANDELIAHLALDADGMDMFVKDLFLCATGQSGVN